MRAYLNEGGKLLFTGKNAGRQYVEAFEYERDGKSHCKFDPKLNDGCFFHSDDFLQYYLGSYVYSDNGGTSAAGTPYPVHGNDDPFGGVDWSFGGDGAANQDHTAAHVITSSILPVSTYPQFRSWEAADWVRPGAAPFAPFSGSEYMYSQRGDVTWKRLTRTVDMTGATSGDLTFQISRDTEVDWDYVFVEAHTVGEDDWTTLPDLNGHTALDAGPADGNGSCSSAWNEIHPFIDHYQTYDGTSACTPTGSSGEFNAATGRSDGWEEWKVDLSGFDGPVELSISYVSDWSIQGLGVFVDDPAVTVDGTTTSTSFEGEDGGWSVPGPPAGSSPNANDWTRSGEAFDEGAVVATPDSLYFGFGFEGISSAAERNTVMGRSMDHLLP